MCSSVFLESAGVNYTGGPSAVLLVVRVLSEGGCPRGVHAVPTFVTVFTCGDPVADYHCGWGWRSGDAATAGMFPSCERRIADALTP